MAGIYVHIPFCKSRCRYCDFFSTTLLHLQIPYIEAVKTEAQLRRTYLGEQTIGSVYLGGGTPSLLQSEQICSLLETLYANFAIDNNAEISIEANPGDLSLEKLRHIRQTGVNRLSIGIQTFSDSALKLLGRRHTASEATDAVLAAREAGFDNISIDLMYGLPGQTLEELSNDIWHAIETGVEHISTYNLTYEDNTPLTQMLRQGLITQQPDDILNQMAGLIYEKLTSAGYIRYEVSNYCKPHYQSRHNSSYWYQIPYIGLGAGAHSFNGKSRQWNISDINRYIDSVRARNLQYEKETLTETDLYNETVMLRLRTKDGICLSELTDADRNYCMLHARSFVESEKLILSNNNLKATLAGFNILDYMTRELMR